MVRGKQQRHDTSTTVVRRRAGGMVLGQEDTRLPLPGTHPLPSTLVGGPHRGHSSIGGSIRLSTGRVRVRAPLASSAAVARATFIARAPNDARVAAAGLPTCNVVPARAHPSS